MLITDKGVLVRTRVSEIRELGRATQGVTLIGLDEGSKLSGLQRIVENDAAAPEGDESGRRSAASCRTRRRRVDPAGRRNPDCSPMKHTMRPYNFSAGPAAMPAECCAGRRRDARLAWQRHERDGDEPPRQGVHQHLRTGRGRLRELLAVPANFRILFMQGGGLGENAIVPLNLSRGRRTAPGDFVVTGGWSQKSPRRPPLLQTPARRRQQRGRRPHHAAVPAGWQLRPQAQLCAPVQQRNHPRRGVPHAA
jgi:hypothetical protein